jgi:uncharacterized membrane protein YfbV (UPF0208 family)
MAFNEMCLAFAVCTSICAISMRKQGMYSFTNRAPANFPLANKALRIFKKQGVSTETGKYIHGISFQ